MRDTYISLQGLVIGFLIVILLFIPIPVIGRFICLWILFVVVCNLVSGDILFSLFISTFFVILFFLYLGPKQTISFSGNTVESFESGELISRVGTLNPHQVPCHNINAQLVAQGGLPQLLLVGRDGFPLLPNSPFCGIKKSFPLTVAGQSLPTLWATKLLSKSISA